MGKSSPSAPTPVDPVVASNAQANANNSTAQAQATLNNVNTYGPNGSVVYNQPGGAGTQWNQTTTLSPGQQQLYDQQTQAQNSALGVANQEIGRVGDALSQGFNSNVGPSLATGVNPSQAQGYVQNYPGQVSGFDQGQSVQGQLGQTPGLQYSASPSGAVQSGVNANGYQSGLGPTQGVQGQVNGGGDIANGYANTNVSGTLGPQDYASVGNVSDAYWKAAQARLDPMYNQRADSLETRLANQGFGMNSTGYANAQDQEARNRNDAYGQALNGAIQAGANEQNVLYGQSLANAQLQNSAAGQQYAQNQGLAQFQNQAQNQQFNQNLQQGNFANSAQAQQYGQNLSSGQFANSATQAGNADALNQGNFANSAQQQQFAQNQAQQAGYNSAVGQQFNQNAAAGQFANQAAAQQYTQNQGAAQFQNQAADTTFQQQFAQAQLGNQAGNQNFQNQVASAQFQNQARTQAQQEQAYAQNLPLQQFQQLMGTGQYQAPTGVQYSPTQVQNTDVLGAYALNQQQQNANYQAQLQQQNGTMSGLFGLGSAAIGVL